ncbi:hypothetical protein CXG81DRAFT_16368 [Caulochytrium protostelioides]|uniref:S-adenosyl-L-methionine-dependent methyltransferase n=1 Tax=Caulochytrium protostelioides TaxID=1555241 RepID=A0A4V1IVJ1_9FUNG|nr:hypothetical protein CXG81DRAFT_16368 [Caulochytrium protostelioides]|eukprot:RKP04239.1 hypothetical protein CXG81DRAFT_16368 [Caulochytrium protostelioides]
MAPGGPTARCTRQRSRPSPRISRVSATSSQKACDGFDSFLPLTPTDLSMAVSPPPLPAMAAMVAQVAQVARVDTHADVNDDATASDHETETEPYPPLSPVLAAYRAARPHLPRMAAMALDVPVSPDAPQDPAIPSIGAWSDMTQQYLASTLLAGRFPPPVVRDALLRYLATVTAVAASLPAEADDDDADKSNDHDGRHVDGPEGDDQAAPASWRRTIQQVQTCIDTAVDAMSLLAVLGGSAPTTRRFTFKAPDLVVDAVPPALQTLVQQGAAHSELATASANPTLRLTVREVSLEDGTGLGLVVWGATVQLATMLAQGRLAPLLAGRQHLLELGCGVPLAGIAARVRSLLPVAAADGVAPPGAGGAWVTVTDYHATVLANATACLALNGAAVAAGLRASLLDWYAPPAAQAAAVAAMEAAAGGRAVDTVLAADVCYEVQDAEQVARVIDHVLNPRHRAQRAAVPPLAIVVLPLRRGFDAEREAFKATAAALGGHVAASRLDPLAGRAEDCELIQITWPAP